MSELRVYADVPDQRCSIGEKVLRLARLISGTTAEKMVNRIEYL